MTSASVVPLDPRQAALVRELTALMNGLVEFREVLRPVNDEALNDAFREILDEAERIVVMHLARPGVYIANDVANLRSLFVRRPIPREDPDLGRIPSLTALRSARGSLLADFDLVLEEARSLGLVPSEPRFDMPTGVEIERAGREGQLAALEQRMRKVEGDLKTKIAPEGRRDEGRSLQQTGLVNFYVGAMKIELTLARLEAKARDLIDLAGLARAIGAIGELTEDFVATVQGLSQKVTDTLKRAAEALRPDVRRVVGGLRTMVAWVRRQARHALPRGLVPGHRFRDFDAAPEIIVVPAGEFLMGSRDDGVEGNDRERPQHKVTIKSAFAVSISPITRGEFAAFLDDTQRKIESRGEASWHDPGFKQQDDHPVVNVNWHDAQAYAAWLRERSGGKAYRLLSEAEWEYCCRAGTTSAYSTGDAVTAEQANFGGNSEGTTPVSKFAPNAWGLRDMHGNVWEWCEDNWHPNYEDAPEDGSAWKGGNASSRVLRGGSWDSRPLILRSAFRYRYHPVYRSIHVGFRVARTL
jgi:formylglycine-generating enzyme required for sulfatase activity